MKDTKLIISILIIALIVIGAFFVFSPKQEEQRVVKIGYLSIITSLPVYVAQENKYFENEGVKVEFIQLQSSNQEIDALVRGDIDIVAISSAVPAFVAEQVDSGKFLIFAVSEPPRENHPFDSIIVKSDSSISGLNDLEGKKIGVFPGSTATNLLKKFLDEKDIETRGIEFVSIVPPNQLPALYSGSIDALHAYEPITTIAVEGENAKVIYPSVYAEQLNNNQGVALISKRFISENSQLASKSISIMNKAFDFTRQNENDARVLLPKYMKLDENVSKKVILANMIKYNEINEDVMQDYADKLYNLGELSNPLDVSTLLYNP